MNSLVAILILMAGTCMADNVDTNLVVVRTVGDVPKDLKNRIMEWVSTSIAPATDTGVFATKETSIKAIAAAVAEVRTNRAQVVLVLAGDCPATDMSLYVFNGAAVVNLNALRLSDMSTPAARETFARRVEKESIDGLARMLYMPPCPFQLCALYEHSSLEELDKKARGLCPPCSGKLPEMIEKYPSRKPPKAFISYPKDGQRLIYLP